MFIRSWFVRQVEQDLFEWGSGISPLPKGNIPFQVPTQTTKDSWPLRIPLKSGRSEAPTPGACEGSRDATCGSFEARNMSNVKQLWKNIEPIWGSNWNAICHHRPTYVEDHPSIHQPNGGKKGHPCKVDCKCHCWKWLWTLWVWNEMKFRPAQEQQTPCRSWSSSNSWGNHISQGPLRSAFA